MKAITLLGLCLTLLQVYDVAGHARLVEPPSRSSMWRFGFSNPADYNDNQGFCGGIKHQFEDMGGKCGICGDAYDDLPRQHEAPKGRYANGIIVRDYQPGQVIDVKVDVTANHYGHFHFKICPNNDIRQDPTQDCFEKFPLKVVDESGALLDKYVLPDQSTRTFFVKVQLPTDLTCQQCILQWTYVGGNNWGTDPDGTSCLGCGSVQEHFRACADIRIQDNNGWETTEKPDSTSSAEIPSSTTEFVKTTTQYHGMMKCVAIAPYDQPGYDDWCTNNCNLGNCPPNMCKCGPA